MTARMFYNPKGRAEEYSPLAHLPAGFLTAAEADPRALDVGK